MADPFESLFSNDSKRPVASREKNLDDIFSTKPSNPTTTSQARGDPFDSLFGPASTTNNHTHSHPASSSNDRLQRPKVVHNATKPIPNRAMVDEVEEFIL